jgi:hypothetical protein
MGNKIFGRIKKTLSIFMMIFCLISITAAVVSASDYGRTSGSASIGGTTDDGYGKTSGGASMGETTAGSCGKTVGSNVKTTAGYPPRVYNYDCMRKCIAENRDDPFVDHNCRCICYGKPGKTCYLW